MPFGFNPYSSTRSQQTDSDVGGCVALLLMGAVAGLSALAVKSFDAETQQTFVVAEKVSYEPVDIYVDLNPTPVDTCGGKSAPAGSLDRQINNELVRNGTCA